MDPKSSQSLDPKLKEIYDRVMGTKLPPQTPEAPQKEAHQGHVTKTTDIKHAELVHAPKVGSFISKASGGMKKSFPVGIILIIMGVLFFVAYALFWIRFFNLPLPFELPF